VQKRITKIEKQAKRDRYNIYLDGIYGFSLSEKVLFDSGLAKNQKLSEKEIDELQDDDRENKAYNRALLILSYRANTEDELKKKLLKNFEEKEIEQVIPKLRQQGFLNDADFAERYAEQSKKGKNLVRLELIKKGINKETIERAVASKDEEKELENAIKIAEKVFKKYQKEPPKVQKQKLYENLTRKGFSYDTFKQVVASLEINK